MLKSKENNNNIIKTVVIKGNNNILIVNINNIDTIKVVDYYDKITGFKIKNTNTDRIVYFKKIDIDSFNELIVNIYKFFNDSKYTVLNIHKTDDPNKFEYFYA